MKSNLIAGVAIALCLLSCTEKEKPLPNDKTIKVTEIQLNSSSLSLTEGETKQLTATVLPENATDKTLTWLSSNDTIATVKDGLITALRYGDVDIIVSCKDSVKAICNISIIPKEVIPINGMSLPNEWLESSFCHVFVGDTKEMNVLVMPSNATEKPVFESSNNSIATVDQTGLITVKSLGTVFISATVTHEGKEDDPMKVGSYLVIFDYETINGVEQKIVKVGNTVWMAENYNELPSVNDKETNSEDEACYYVYGYDGTDLKEAKAHENYKKYGVLYNYPAAVKACPKGWHIATAKEWQEVEQEIGMTELQANGTEIRPQYSHRLRSCDGWLKAEKKGIDLVGLGILDGGFFDTRKGFKNAGMTTILRTSTPKENLAGFTISRTFTSSVIDISKTSSSTATYVRYCKNK